MTAPGASSVVLLVLSYVGFVSLGLPDTLLGAAWPSMRRTFGASLDFAGVIMLVTTAGVVVSSMFSGRLLRHLRTGTVLTGSTVLAATALLLFAWAPSPPFLLLAAALAGGGGGAVDAALNGYVARNHSARHMSWLHGCWGVGATVGPAVVTAVLAMGHSWRAGYAVLAMVQVFMAVAFLCTRAWWPHVAPEKTDRGSGGRFATTMISGVAFFFLYGALEASAGLWCASYLIEVKGASATQAGSIVATYWGALMVGRFVAGALAARIGEARFVRLSCWMALGALLLMAWPAVPTLGVGLAFVVLGFSLAPVYPMTMHLTPKRHGEAASMYLVGYQVAACSAGIALMPWLLGVVAKRTSLQVMPPALLGLALLLVVISRRWR